MHLAFWKKRDRKEIYLLNMKRAPIFGIVFGIAYQVICIIGAMVFQMSLLVGAGYQLIFWPTRLILQIAPFTSNLFASASIALCKELPGRTDIAERSSVFVCNMAFAIILNLVITTIIFALVGLLISLVIVAIRKRRGFKV